MSALAETTGEVRKATAFMQAVAGLDQKSFMLKAALLIGYIKYRVYAINNLATISNNLPYDIAFE